MLDSQESGWRGCNVEQEWLPEATVEIRMLGVVAAGQPYRAFELDDSLSVPAGLWDVNKVFALRVTGSSMIDEGIHDGDYLIVEPREMADNGQTVVAEVDGCVTVKKLYRSPDGQVRLQPANPELLPLVLRGDQIRVRGVVVGVLRKYGFKRRPARPVPIPRRNAGISRPARPAPDKRTLDLEVNVLDAQLARWEKTLASAREQPLLQRQVRTMEGLGRDLQSLRDWCARTDKPSLRRALLAEANRIMRRMERFSRRAVTDLDSRAIH